MKNIVKTSFVAHLNQEEQDYVNHIVDRLPNRAEITTQKEALLSLISYCSSFLNGYETARAKAAHKPAASNNDLMI